MWLFSVLHSIYWRLQYVLHISLHVFDVSECEPAQNFFDYRTVRSNVYCLTSLYSYYNFKIDFGRGKKQGYLLVMTSKYKHFLKFYLLREGGHQSHAEKVVKYSFVQPLNAE